MTGIRECILYRDFEQGELLEKMTMLMEDISHPKVLYGKDGEYFACIHQLVEMAGTYGFAGNLWHDYLTYLLVNHENAFSTACEIVGPVEGTINAFAMHDFEIFKQLYDFDLKELEKIYPSVDSSLITDYQNINEGSKVFNKRIRDRICTLAQKLAKAESTEEFMDDMVQFYKEFGVGKLGLHKAFRIDGTVTPARIVPITNIAHVHLDDLVGYEIAKKKLIDNTEAFVQGRPANNCLLFGDAGTGKSSSIKGILNQYYDQGLRIIEAYKHQFKDLNDIIAQVKNRNYKFIIYMDDLSFEEFEIEYKYLKAVIEGGLEKKPDNILIYATSNRRHLVREKFSDKEERRDDLHSSDTVQEKLSLVARFGVSIFFCAPDKKQFQNIVKTLAERHQVEMPEEELLLEANKWELQHGGLSGRTAQQFIDYLCGKNKNK
ncbi:MAG: ATP-binding protein [Oliverpabstia intestinalis]|jgi:predicted AAA+ superfamily ATPase|uniref:ATP-binding protein n=1 Tax=Oliverpabstia intestinalis TaxID=2606633 RepID=A0A7X2TL21_9FIRM|nr:MULTISPECIES: ATP-binding protein [Oliverpabstia]MEE1180578.1 ATP-binding protein [Lachnospiraceae bacterium]MCI7526145.1 ATP-binding protein [Oliverpabstia sp.]MDD6410682.1 ATP-binding protein [Oliverpabstia intestinalis]MDY5790748.1 ATP-binding protein [Oliverpabstia intestinalis]MST66861.1 ATP-binding protein [Oliverpabstia intestinalis]